MARHKIATTALIVFFPVASAFAEGLARAPGRCFDLARVIGGGRSALLPASADPDRLACAWVDLRLASIDGPVGAVIDEWVGASDGQRALMIHADGRMRFDVVFALADADHAVRQVIPRADHARYQRLPRFG